MSELLIPSAINPTGKPDTDPTEQAKQRIAILEALQWLERLDANADFQRFLALAQQGVDAMEEFGSKLEGTTAEIRDGYNQRRWALNDMVKYPARQMVMLREHLARLNDPAQ